MRRTAVTALSGRPKVSVVVPCYNYGRYLPAAVASALDQPGVEVEVIVADNSSTDDSLDVARELAERDNRIQVIEQHYNKPYLENYNDGLDFAAGDYVVVLDADDLLTPGSLTRAAALMEAHPEVSFAYGHCRRFTDQLPTPKTTSRSWLVWSGEEWAERLYRRGRNMLLSPEVLVRTSRLREVGGFDVGHPTGADLLLWLQLSLRGGVGRINGADQAYYRVHPDNMHYDTTCDGLLPDLRARRTIFDLALERDGDLLAAGSAQGMRDSVHRALAGYAVRGACAAYDATDLETNSLSEEFAEFALDTYPAIAGERQWKAVQRRRRATQPAWRTAVDRSVRHARRQLGVRLNRVLEW